MEVEEEAELLQLAVQDFTLAFAQQGPQEAAATLQSYLQELHNAPQPVLLQLAAAFCKLHMVAALAAGGVALHQLAALQELLLRVVVRSSAAVKQVQGVWQDAAMALLYGRGGETATAAVERLDSCRGQLAVLLGDCQLQSLPPPATHQQRRSMLACLLHLQLLPAAESVPAATLQALCSLAAPPWFGRELLHARQQQAATFEAFAVVVQRHAGATDHRQGLSSTQHQTALDFLKLFRPPLPAVTEYWWAHLVALLHGLVQQALDSGTAALRRPALQALLRCLCCQETAHMVVPLVLVHPAYQPEQGPAAAPAGAEAGGFHRRKKASGTSARATKGGLSMAAALLAHDVPAFLAGCCELLRPEANYELQTRVEVLAAMDRAAGAYLKGAPGQEEGSALRLWTPAALEQLLFVLRGDPSIRVRRATMRLLSSVAVAVGSPQEAALLRAVVERCRDKDAAVRQEAFAMLVQFPRASLERLLALGDWQAVLDLGLAGPLPGSGSRGGGGGGGAQGASKHVTAVRTAAVQLLQCYLGVSEEADGAGGGSTAAEAAGEGPNDADEEPWDGDGGEEGQVDSTVASDSGDDSWLERLQVLQLPAAHSTATGPVAQHLRAAWDDALPQILSPEQVAACGGVTGLLV